MCYHAVYMCMFMGGCEQPLRRHVIFQRRLKWAHVHHLKQLDECLTRSHLCTWGRSHPEGRAVQVHRIQSLHAELLCHSPLVCRTEASWGTWRVFLFFLRCMARKEGTVLSRRQRRGRYIYFIERDSVTFQVFPIAFQPYGPGRTTIRLCPLGNSSP